MEEVAVERLLRTAGDRDDRPVVDRIIAHGSPGAGRWQHAAPSKTLDMNLTNAELTTYLRLQLGVDVFDEEVPCPYCGSVNDRRWVETRTFGIMQGETPRLHSAAGAG